MLQGRAVLVLWFLFISAVVSTLFITIGCVATPNLWFCRMSSVACCLWSIARCMQHAARCWLHVIGVTSAVACCSHQLAACAEAVLSFQDVHCVQLERAQWEQFKWGRAT